MTTSERSQIEQAIAALEVHRDLIGDAVVDTAVSTLQEQLATIQGAPRTGSLRPEAQRKQITTMFANITGLAGLADSLQDTDLLDITRALWRRMDRAIAEQGGTIDKHVVDGVMGLFGVPIAHEDDPERAIRAALAVRTTLADFIDELGVSAHPGVTAWRERTGNVDSHPFRDVQLRVGINTGPVLLGKVGTGDEYTVIGAAVNLASRLERMAPAGGILISHDTYLLVQGIFNIDSLAPIEIKGIGERVPIYLVLGMNPRNFHRSAWGVKGIQTQMVGRGKALGALQQALQVALNTGQGRAIEVTGEAGVGKSRLLYEFSRWIASTPEKIVTFRGRSDQKTSQLPYSLIRDILATHFSIQDTDQASAVESKLTSGMGACMELSDLEARSRANAIGQLIGLSVVSDTHSLATRSEAPQMRARVFDYLTEFFEAVASGCDALLIVLEDMHWSDPQSLQLVDHLAQSCRRAPILLVSLCRPQTADEPLGVDLSDMPATPLSSSQTIELQLLSATESRQLVLDILQKVPACPDDLCQLIVSRADGNPFYVEEMIKVLIEDGVILTGEGEWQVVRDRFRSVRIPPTLTGVLQARLDRLSAMEKVTLQHAAVVGRLFWDSAVIQIGEMANDSKSAADVRATLKALTKRELIFQLSTSGFANTEAYSFKHAFLRDVTYESVLLRERPVYHKLTADWLAERSGDRIAEYAQLIAEHYEQAREHVTAAELYEIAAGRAREMYNPVVAIDYYRRALWLLKDEPLQAALKVTLFQQLAPLLRSQARLIEASQVYLSMQRIAEQDGDLVAQARAQNGLAEICRDQAAYDEMLLYADQARQVAWLVSADEEMAQALLWVGEAHHRLGRPDAGVAAAQEALELSLRSNLIEATSSSLSLLGTIHLETGSDLGASRYFDLLEQQRAYLDGVSESMQLKALTSRLLGDLYRRSGQLDQATYLGLETLEIYREGDYQKEIAEILGALAKVAVWRKNLGAARPLLQEAVAIANAIGDEYNALSYRTQLAAVLNGLGEHRRAKQLLNQVLQVVGDVARFKQWPGLPAASIYLAEAHLGEEQTVEEALALALQAYRQVQSLAEPILAGMIWRVLGEIASRLPSQASSISIDENLYHPADCFAESMRLLRQASGNRHLLYQAQLETLLAWAAYEQGGDNQERANQLQTAANSLTSQLSAMAEQWQILKSAAGDNTSPDVA